MRAKVLVLGLLVSVVTAFATISQRELRICTHGILQSVKSFPEAAMPIKLRRIFFVLQLFVGSSLTCKTG